MAKKVTNVEANANVNDANVVMVKTTAPKANVVAEETAEEVAEEVVENDIFSSFFEDDNDEATKSREDIIKELLASGTCRRINNLTVKNVVATEFDTHALLTFVVKEFVIGDVADAGNTDAFGQQVFKLGKTHNVQTSSFAVAGVMKDTPKTAVFATELVDNPSIANLLFAGGKIDVILQYVAAGEEYVNPFASNAESRVFERDKMIHHIVKLELGEVGIDKYHALISK